MKLPGEIDRTEYDAFPAVRWSMLSHMRKSPAHYKHALTNERKETSALRTGSALHTLVFEPETFGERFTTYLPSKTKGEGARSGEMHHTGLRWSYPVHACSGAWVRVPMCSQATRSRDSASYTLL